ncbi:MAG TPA: long-chain fatty acid--CoA ligase [Thermoanaerobaculia bacterium]|nr:long-chain fatty acid--CoA ligase [Thermoanaerobaculia bacterium]
MTPDTLPKLLVARARERGSATALREKELGIWRALTWREYLERVRDTALGFLELGVAPGDRIAILGDNRPEWVIAELAAQSVGAVSMGVYQDSVAEEVEFLIAFCEATLVVAEDQEQVDKILESRAGLPTVRRVLFHDPRGLRKYDDPLLVDLADVERMGARRVAECPDEFGALVEATRPDDVAILSTTSGTTGKPKLAMLTHRNLVAMARSFTAVEPLAPGDEFLSFLPLPWIGEQMIGVACALQVGFTVNFPEEPETAQQDLREIGPHMLFSPPRIWENMVSEVQVKIEDSSWLKRAVYAWSMRQGYAAADRRLAKRPLPPGLALQSRLAELVCFLWIKDKLGLRRLKRAYTGGAALGPDIFRFFHALGVNLKQIYGQTEVSGISVLHRDGDIKFQTVGLPVPGAEIRIDENGEILTRSPAVFVGYYNNPEATEETLEEGWLHSGDAGYLDQDGHLIVIDRAKDVMTLHDGTRFSPQFIENKLKFSPYVREAVVFGGDWPFVTAMITIDFANAGKWAEKKQLPYTTFTDLSQKPEIYGLVREHVERMNEDLPEAARIRRFLLLHKELDADDAELTRTRKVRRSFVAERYRPLVDALYGGRESVPVETVISYQDGRTATTRTELKIEG